MTESIGGIITPGDLLLLHRDHPSRYPFLLQSTAAGNSLGRYDILFGFPGETLELDPSGQLRGRATRSGLTFLDALDEWWSAERVTPSDDSLPFLGGWFLYLAYELAGQVEPALVLQQDTVLPAAFAVRCKTALVIDHRQSSCYLVCESSDDKHRAQVRKDIDAISRNVQLPAVTLKSVCEETPRQFIDSVYSAKNHIAKGDIYQANLSRKWATEVAAEASGDEIYAALCKTNPAPFAGIARWQDAEIISSSPERLLRIRNGFASTRPIAGTRPRSGDFARDNTLSEELISHPKERAEHVMLIDLERNDLGKVCAAGSVEVDEMMVLESYAHVHHIVSNIKGKLRSDVTPGQAIAAVFPGGTITGCPKIRCMEIIAELENSPRGAYTGSFGYLNTDGSLDLNILIRTMVKQGNSLSFRAGSGIVADSNADAELEETRAKAKGMLRALGKFR